MAKWKPNMTLSQRRRYNESMRMYRLRRALREGRVPQARKDVTPAMMEEYRRAGVELAVTFPQVWMDDELKAATKEEKKKVRAAIRNLLPAEYPKKKFERVIVLYLSGAITKEDIMQIE